MASKWMPTAVVALLLIPHAHSQGYIVPNGVTSATFGPHSDFQVLQNPTNGNVTDFIFYTETSGPFTSSFRFYRALDFAVAVFFVSANDPLTAQAIHSGSYVRLQDGG